MKQFKNLLFLLSSIIGAFIISSCNNDDVVDPPTPQNYDVTFKFSHTFDGAGFAYDTFGFTNAAGNELKFSTLRYLISEIELVKADGSVIKIEDKFAFINPKEDYDSFVLNDIPEGDYKGLNFVIGLDSITNHSNPNLFEADHPLNPLVNNMHWSWAEGYIFLTLEGKVKIDSGQDKGFSYHVALLENRMPIELTNSFSITGSNTVGLEMEVDEVFVTPTEFDINEWGNVSHSTGDNGLANTLRDNALDAFRITGVN